MRLLSSDSFGSFGASGIVLDMLLPQLCHSIPSVQAAAIALGAVHELQASHLSGRLIGQPFAAFQYQVALRAMRQDLLRQPDGPVPLILICFMLSVVEMFMQQEKNALMHLRGAFKLMSHARNARPKGRDVDPSTPEEHLELLLHTIDSQTCSYAPSKALELSTMPIPSSLPLIKDLRSAHIILVRLVHLCYNFTSTNYKFRYQPQSAAPSLYIQQGRLIAHLSTWLEQHTLNILPKFAREPVRLQQAKVYNHALTLRVTALSTLISLSCIFCPYEMAYDSHAAHFQQIVADSDAIVSGRHGELNNVVKGIDGQRFQAGPGIIQPLFLTATKYRHPRHRRHAIRLLSLAGCEGPWTGPREARIGTRIMELEENGAYHSSASLATSASLSEISEPVRIHEIGLKTVCANGRPSSKVIVNFHRCGDLESMMSYPCGHGAGSDQALDSHSNGPCINNIQWETWIEELEVEVLDYSNANQ